MPRQSRSRSSSTYSGPGTSANAGTTTPRSVRQPLNRLVRWPTTTSAKPFTRSTAIMRKRRNARRRTRSIVTTRRNKSVKPFTTRNANQPTTTPRSVPKSHPKSATTSLSPNATKSLKSIAPNTPCLIAITFPNNCARRYPTSTARMSTTTWPRKSLTRSVRRNTSTTRQSTRRSTRKLASDTRFQSVTPLTRSIAITRPRRPVKQNTLTVVMMRRSKCVKPITRKCANQPTTTRRSVRRSRKKVATTSLTRNATKYHTRFVTTTLSLTAIRFQNNTVPRNTSKSVTMSLSRYQLRKLTPSVSGRSTDITTTILTVKPKTGPQTTWAFQEALKKAVFIYLFTPLFTFFPGAIRSPFFCVTKEKKTITIFKNWKTVCFKIYQLRDGNLFFLQDLLNNLFLTPPPLIY